MRGKGCDFPGRVGAQGITPAHAGKRHTVQGGMQMVEDHPRTCGEKRGAGDHGQGDQGSPPHMRGKGRDGTGYRLLQRITPAHAGKSKFTTALLLVCMDHPRTCGEKTKKIP